MGDVVHFRSRAAAALPWWTSVVVCRACCCGTTRKHPDLDHDRQLETLRRAAADAGSILRVSGCQGICVLSNLVVLRHHSRRIEIGHVVSDAATEAVATWIRHPTRVPDPQTGVILLGPLSFVVPAASRHRRRSGRTARTAPWCE